MLCPSVRGDRNILPSFDILDDCLDVRGKDAPVALLRDEDVQIRHVPRLRCALHMHTYRFDYDAPLSPELAFPAHLYLEARHLRVPCLHHITSMLDYT